MVKVIWFSKDELIILPSLNDFWNHCELFSLVPEPKVLQCCGNSHQGTDLSLILDKPRVHFIIRVILKHWLKQIAGITAKLMLEVEIRGLSETLAWESDMIPGRRIVLEGNAQDNINTAQERGNMFIKISQVGY